jgi:hypothetical protein
MVTVSPMWLLPTATAVLVGPILPVLHPSVLVLLLAQPMAPVTQAALSQSAHAMPILLAQTATLFTSIALLHAFMDPATIAPEHANASRIGSV